jgi:hypothetical protein
MQLRALTILPHVPALCKVVVKLISINVKICIYLRLYVIIMVSLHL